MPIKVIVLEDGPIIVEQGNEKTALCRCGRTENAPNCDGSHVGQLQSPGLVIEEAPVEDEQEACCSC